MDTLVDRPSADEEIQVGSSGVSLVFTRSGCIEGLSVWLDGLHIPHRRILKQACNELVETRVLDARLEGAASVAGRSLLLFFANLQRWRKKRHSNAHRCVGAFSGLCEEMLDSLVRFR